MAFSVFVQQLHVYVNICLRVHGALACNKCSQQNILEYQYIEKVKFLPFVKVSYYIGVGPKNAY
jgi:hypothetical protein